MKIVLNNQNVILKQFGIEAANCYLCCFLQNWSLCGITELRDHTICRAVKILDKTQLNDVFKL